MQLSQTIKESEVFFKEWLRAPKAMGSIFPSSAILARAIAGEVAWQPGQTVVELGGGTGSISQGLLDAGIPQDNLLIIEYAEEFCDYLKQHFPGCRVIKADATKLPEILRDQQVSDVSTVISGLPMIGNPTSFRKAIVHAGFAALPAHGFMLQYSYSPICPIPAKELQVKAELVRYVWRNLPPAAVWKYARQT